MKKYIYIIVLISIIVRCTDFLEEEAKGKIVAESFYNNAEELELAVTAMHRRLIYTNYFGHVDAPYLGGNDVTSTEDDFREFDVFNASGDNTMTEWLWDEHYTVIACANDLIHFYKKAKATEEEKNHAAGQAYFARAYSYFSLVRVWNKIPVNTGTSNEFSFDIVPSEPEVTYNVIIEDLKKAEEMLPVKWSGYKENVVMTRGAAKSLLAYVYLSMAGYPVNDESKYALAAEKAKEVIDNENVYGYRLLENFEDLWKWENSINDESVYIHVFNVNDHGNSRAPFASQPPEYTGWDFYFAEINFFNDFPEGPRKDATFVTEFPMEDGRILDWTEIIQKHPYYYKYWDIEGFNPDEPWIYVDWQSNRPNVILRHANTLLVYAEAQAMANSSPDVSAYEAVNRVRNRAGLPNLTEGLTREAFRDSVVAERSWEFAGGEFFVAPWYDLVRLERVEEAAADRHFSEQPLAKSPTKEDYFAPYPDDDVVKNPNLTN